MEKGTKENPRHIMGLSGGKDSTALAIHIKNTRPDIHDKIEYFFSDTQAELPEIYTYLEKLEKYLEKPIQFIKTYVDEDKRIQFTTGDTEIKSFDDVLYNKYKGFLPAPNARWCTRDLKIIPMEKWIGEDYCFSYIGIRADEDRGGYVKGGKSNITPVMPFQKDGLVLNDIYRLLDESVGIGEYYKWRTRSGCTFCFYQRRCEYAVMFYLYPHLFEDAKTYETEHSDGRQFTWVKDKPLDYIADNAKEILTRYIKKQYKKATDKEKSEFTMSLDEMLQMIEEEKIQEFIDTWDLKRLHDAGGKESGKDGCTVCAI